jgi:uncharacterized membrane protein YsdA (DUF1294 family)
MEEYQQMSHKRSQTNKPSMAQWLYAIVLLGLVVLLYAFIFPATEWSWYIVWLISWSVATFMVYGLDKAAAKAGLLRSPELLLHLAALVGGFAGGWLGMFVWHHKVKKQIFYLVLLASTLLHAAIIYYVFFAARH